MRYFKLALLALALATAVHATAQAQVDLQIGRITTDRSKTKVLVEVKNSGRGAFRSSALSVTVRNRADDRVLANRLIPITSISGGKSRTMVVDRLPRIGSVSVTAIVDPRNLVPESDENNNRVVTGLAVAQPVPRIVDLEITQVRADSPARVSVTLRNNGPAPLLKSTDVRFDRFQDGRNQRFFRTVSRLDAQGRILIVFDLRRSPLQEGAGVVASADSRRRIAETNEHNNVRAIQSSIR